MAIEIIEDTIDNSSYREDGDGEHVTRAFLVFNMDLGVAYERQWAASNLSGIPKINDSHPFIPFIRCKNKTVEAFDSETYIVTAFYTRLNGNEGAADDDGPGQLSIGSSLTTLRTSEDANGVQMILTPTAGSNPGGDPLAPQPVIVDVSHATFYAVWERRESTSPDSKAVQYTNKVSSTPFLGLPAGQAYCESITGVSNDGNDTFTVTYTFKADPLGFNIISAYTDPTTGAPVASPAPSIANGTLKEFTMFGEEDFTVLGLA